jgi:hypothetical protein
MIRLKYVSQILFEIADEESLSSLPRYLHIAWEKECRGPQMFSQFNSPTKLKTQMEFQFNNLHFESFPDDAFRLHCGNDIHNSKKASNLVLWMESRKTKAQWIAEVMDDVSKYGPIGIPLEVLFESLRQALELREGNDLVALVQDNETVTSGEGAKMSVTCNIDDCSKAMTLELSMFITKGWSNVYNFVLEWKEVPRVEIIVAKLRDAEEQIEYLKEELKKKENNNKAIIKIKIDANNSNPVVWNRANSLVVTGDKNVFDELVLIEGTKFRLLKPGMYRITCDAVLYNYQYSSYTNPNATLTITSFVNPNQTLFRAMFPGYYSTILEIKEVANVTLNHGNWMQYNGNTGWLFCDQMHILLEPLN